MITMDVFFAISLGIELKSCQNLHTSKIAHFFELNMEDFVRRIFVHPLRPWSHIYSLPSIQNIKRWCRDRFLRGIIHKRIREKRVELALARQDVDKNGGGTNENDKNRKKKTRKKKDLLTNILDAQNKVDIGKENLTLTDDECAGFIESLLIAGFETTSITLVYAFYSISLNPDIENDLMKEIRTVISDDGDDDAARTNFDVEQLVLCKAIIMESLRLYPIAYQVLRTIPDGSKIEIDGSEIIGPATVRIPIWAIQRCEDYFPRPTEFLPHRWVRKTKAGHWVERHPEDDCEEEKEWMAKCGVPPGDRSAYLAFSSGARNCPGKKFAYQEAVVILATLLKDLKFEVEEDYVCVPVRSGVVQVPKYGMPMYISERVQ